MIEKLSLCQTKKVLQFHELDRSKELALMYRIAKFNGLIRIMVHPFYEEYISSKEWLTHICEMPNQRIIASTLGLYRILGKSIETTPATIVFEDEDYMRKTHSRLYKMLSEGNVTYLLPTYYDCAVPKIEHNNGFKPFDWFNKKLKSMGVKTVILGGQRLIIEPGEQFTNSNMIGYNTFRCVSEVKKALDPKLFRVIDSGLSYPHSRRDIARVNSEYQNFDEEFAIKEVISDSTK